MKIKKTLSILFICACCCSILFGQNRKPVRALLSIENHYLIAKFNNPIRIVAQQNQPVSINQLSATFQGINLEKEEIEITKKGEYFIINPTSIGTVEIQIRIDDEVEKKSLVVRPMEAVGRLGRHRANSDTKIKVAEFKAQLGIIASIECCGFDAKCRVLGFQVLRINNRNQTERAINQGGKFTGKTKEIIMKAKLGDLFIFRQIKYQCPGSKKPQRLDDMIFEIQ